MSNQSHPLNQLQAPESLVRIMQRQDQKPVPVPVVVGQKNGASVTLWKHGNKLSTSVNPVAPSDSGSQLLDTIHDNIRQLEASQSQSLSDTLPATAP